MKIKIAKTAGFCMGVKRAIEIALDAAKNKPSPIFTLGPLIHNDQAVKMLLQKGIKVIEKDEEPKEGTLVIRAHGIPPEVRRRFENKGLEIVDATCPHVVCAQHIVKKYAALSYNIVICGDRDHAEVQGLLGHCQRGVVIKSMEEAKKIKQAGPICLLAQTTFNEILYEEIVKILKAKIEGELIVCRTICSSTSVRQAEARQIAKEVEAMIVVGGRHSANTCRLAETSKAEGALTFHIETAKELDKELLAGNMRIGITAGASTPSWITHEVINSLSEIDQEKGFLKGLLRKSFKILVLSNFYAALGAGFLTYISSLVQQIPVNRIACFISFAYIFSIYIFNRRKELEEERLFIPERIVFYQKHQRLLFSLACLLTAGSILLSISLGPGALILLGISYGIGLLYSLKIISDSRIKLQRLKDIPASKDIFVAIAWTIVSAIIPFLSASLPLTRGRLLLFLFVFLAILARTISFDLADIAGDRLIGKETTPALMGRRKTEVLLFALIGSLLILIFTATLTLGWPRTGFLLALVPVYLGLYLFLYHRRVYISEVSSRFFLDGMLILPGLFGLILRL